VTQGVLLSLDGSEGGAASETALLKRLSPLGTADRLMLVVAGLGLSAPLPRLGELHSMGIGEAYTLLAVSSPHLSITNIIIISIPRIRIARRSRAGPVCAAAAPRGTSLYANR